MKLDKDLVREILLQIEASPTPMGFVNLDFPEHSNEVVSYHVELLSEAGFIEAYDLTTMDGYEWRPKRLTYEGHQFLETVRDSAIWKTTKETAKRVGSSSVQVLFEIGKNVVKQELVKHGVHLS